MSIAQELERLHQLHSQGALSADEFSRAKARVLNGAGPAGSLRSSVNTLARSRRERWLGGVCGGLAQSTGLAPWLWRLVFALLVPMGGMGVLLYLLTWLFLPLEAPTAPPALAQGSSGPV